MLTGHGAVAVVAVAGLLASPVPPDPGPAGDGWGSTTCSETPSPECELDAGTPGGGPVPSPRVRDRDPSDPDPDPDPEAGRGGGGGGGPADVGVRCSYVRSDYQPPAGGVRTVAYTPAPERAGGAAVPPGGAVAAVSWRPTVRPTVGSAGAQVEPPDEDGAWYVWKCAGEGNVDALYRPPVFIPDGQEPGAVPGPSPAELAQRARNQLRLPAPSIATSPTGEQLVNVPTWLWLSQGWDSVSATAAVQGVSVTAVATPRAVTWSMGDGATVTCGGPGTPFTPGTDPSAASPDCGHLYRSSSAGQPGQAFPVTATVAWTVIWSGAGEGGTFPDLDSTVTTTFRVAEVQVLNDGG